MQSSHGEGGPGTSSDAPLYGGASGEPLLPGWTEERNEAGRTFYVNHETRATQWERPVA